MSCNYTAGRTVPFLSYQRVKKHRLSVTANARVPTEMSPKAFIAVHVSKHASQLSSTYGSPLRTTCSLVRHQNTGNRLLKAALGALHHKTSALKKPSLARNQRQTTFTAGKKKKKNNNSHVPKTKLRKQNMPVCLLRNKAQECPIDGQHDEYVERRKKNAHINAHRG